MRDEAFLAQAGKLGALLDELLSHVTDAKPITARRRIAALPEIAEATLSVNGHRDLYDFWGGTPAQPLAAEADFMLNLASREYSRAVEPHLPETVRFLTCAFGGGHGSLALSTRRW